MNECSSGQAGRLNALLMEAELDALTPEQAARFEKYLALFMRWNARMNLSAIRDEEGILTRHFVESIACARVLPVGIATLLDFGSGGGLPGVPIAICRPEIAVTLAESQSKKAAFLRETVRALELPVAVHAGRAEALHAHFDCVVMRAVDRMAEAVKMAAGLVGPLGWLVLMTTGDKVGTLEAAAGAEFSWSNADGLPRETDQLIALGKRLDWIG